MIIFALFAAAPLSISWRAAYSTWWPVTHPSSLQGAGAGPEAGRHRGDLHGEPARIRRDVAGFGQGGHGSDHACFLWSEGPLRPIAVHRPPHSPTPPARTHRPADKVGITTAWINNTIKLQPLVHSIGAGGASMLIFGTELTDVVANVHSELVRGGVQSVVMSGTTSFCPTLDGALARGVHGGRLNPFPGSSVPSSLIRPSVGPSLPPSIRPCIHLLPSGVPVRATAPPLARLLLSPRPEPHDDGRSRLVSARATALSPPDATPP